MSFADNLKEKYYTMKDMDKFILDCGITKCRFIGNGKKEFCANIPCAFDIETTSFYYDNVETYSHDNEEKSREKAAVMYIWQFGINGICIIGRYWHEFVTLVNEIAIQGNLTETRKLICYVHNLSYEFQFMRKHFEWNHVFAVDSRKPIKAEIKQGIIFKDSYILSGTSLKKVGDDLQKYKVSKLVGDLDYSKIRHNETKLTEKELGYCLNDIKVVMCYIQEKIEKDGNIVKIPLTKTSYVRKYCRSWCFYGDNKRKRGQTYIMYKNLMSLLTLSADEYKQCKRAFQGGFTHANAHYVGQLLHDVASFDFTSSYPTVMLTEFYPMSSATIEDINSSKKFYDLINRKCCIFDIQFINLKPKVMFENPLSRSKCFICENAIENNGRIVYADKVATTITNVDFKIFEKFYTWDSFSVTNFRSYRMEYLPTNFVKSILKLYADKTTLKGVQGKEVEYLLSKGMLNSTYGMTVTDIVKDNQLYDSENGWYIESPNLEESIEKYNEGKGRFLFYLWGIFVTAYARLNLFSGILACGMDYVYSDTDSIKVLNYENHMEYINRYNDNIIKKLETAMKYHKIDISAIRPKTIKGDEKIIGIWDFEGVYKNFKTLGAKRYMVYDSDNCINFTIAGLNKKVGVPYLLDITNTDYEIDKYGNCITNNPTKVFNAFKIGLFVPGSKSGKLLHTYIDNEYSGYLTDYQGKTIKVNELSFVHLSNASYELSISKLFEEFLRSIKTNEVL